MSLILVSEDYGQLIQTGGPVLIAFVVFFGAIYFVGKRVLIPALNIYREITLDVAHITDTLKDTRKRLEIVAHKLDEHLPENMRHKEASKSIYDT